MLDFWSVEIHADGKKPNEVTIEPEFFVNLRTKDLMIRGGGFYAVWDPETNLWSTSEQTVIDIVDGELKRVAKDMEASGKKVKVKYMYRASSKSIDKWHYFVKNQMSDCFHMLDEKIIFANSKTKRTDYASKKLPYALEEGDISAYDELISTLYDPVERQKIEWAIGAIISGDAKHIQKFEVLYGSHGTGKSTILKIIEKLFDGYWNSFNAKELGSASSAFALESFKTNPLVSIQHDGDLSKIEDNTKLNTIISHESLPLNAKYEKIYTTQFKSFLFMGTNTPVKITEAKSGIIRRLIDVYPSGRKLPYKKYAELNSQTQFELGAIAYHCLNVYKQMGEDFYETYVPTEMISATNDFYDFIVYKYDDLAKKEYITQTEAWGLYLEYCEFAHAKALTYRSMGVELRNYYKEFYDRKRVDGRNLRNVYTGFIKDKFSNEVLEEKQPENEQSWLKFDQDESIFDKIFADCPAQYCKEDGSPKEKWEKVKSKLCDIDTRKLHWMKLPNEYIVIDFDKKDLDGKKSLKENLKAASKWKKTYAELSKSGEAIHLVYKYEGDTTKLNFLFEEDVEIKTFKGNSSLRRLLSKCNDIDIATLKEGSLPLKGDARVINWDGIKNDKILRRMILKNLHKEYHPDTSSSIDFIKKLLDDAYDAGFSYDVSDLHDYIRKFALNSTNQSEKCIKVVAQMKFKSAEPKEVPLISEGEEEKEPEKLVFFDVEVYKNFFGIVWKYGGSDTCVKMINPTPEEVAEFIRTYQGCLVGFNNRQYDNHMLWARAFQARSNMGLYNLSQQIINDHTGFIKEAYDISYTDVYDFCAEKKSLKKWEVALGIHHQEMGIPWDEPVPDDMIDIVMDYCENDVRATEAVFNKRYGDFAARKFQVALVNAIHGDDAANIAA